MQVPKQIKDAFARARASPNYHTLKAICAPVGKALKQLAARGWRHWAVAAVLIFIGVEVGHLMDHYGVAMAWRYRIYQLIEHLSPRRAERAKSTVLILIGDEEYWKGELARRSPIKRSYLAKLVKRLDEANVKAIAIDFDFRSSTQDPNWTDHDDYRAETQEFLSAIRDVSVNRPVILPRTVNLNPKSQKYKAERSIYDDFDFKPGVVPKGYVELPNDIRQVPLAIETEDGTFIDSMAAAIIRATDAEAIPSSHGVESRHFPYGTFLDVNAFKSITSEYLLKAPLDEVKKHVGYKVAIIGADWHIYGHNRGQKVDIHASPVGAIGGVFLHANYVEALLDSRSLKPVSGHLSTTIEIAAAVCVAIIFGFHMNALMKVMTLCCVLLVLVVLTFVFWQNFGVFIESFIPVALLAGHAIVEQVLEWRKKAKLLDALKINGGIK
jgi:hypothetical protein